MRSRGVSGVLGGVVVAALVIGALAVIGHLNPVRQSIVSTDRLGPDSGEQVAEYLARAEESLRSDTTEPRWGSVSFDRELTAEQVRTVADGVRISQVLVRVPLDRVQTPILTVGVPGSERSVLNSTARAASLAAASFGVGDRQAQIAAVSQRRLLDGCACVVTVVVRGTPAELTELAGRPDVRAVQALPPDAVSGKFAVEPLLPEYVDVVGPLPDDGLVPTE
ncbi:hypothetical protein CH306_20195 [Rhodococcus sp. 15-725-2-2b]|jgi:hypothetical protein|uniref:hypothetical protein n=1 Tax=unclassified Rhodococcus (in: high G+C Gram-positive bacteria) TaxID=192944 RepID=UPI000B9C64D6|nr:MULTISPECIES: hypothetical protein [unclassified Rhodococcus (in: high G+C Gram-positive bacteria)]OZC64915.1 hypothetical protein CH277_20100 [Rhodococcus sp. 06-469-3-2]OZD46581.1 hypothetical protein CH264_09645 [Rhodococcus sp. 06-1477-1A]OZE04139.1 hypothetical protein CH250_21960 [Rhodococcus sp. 05-2255-3C]OZE10731.1 hypothetical protein CH249_13330 [Rhodococcus sp. 05-2255-3B1]OZE20807.1 hypothetical protein CH255_09500 [Rhodococcus sp. 05-2255-2A2]